MSLRKSFYDEHGGFDEAIGARTPVAGGMENGLFFMVLKHGGKLVHTPSAVVFHHEPAEMSDLRRKLMEGMTAQTAYLTKLLVTERGFRGRTLKLALRQCGKYFRAAAREGGQTGASSPLSLLDELWALARGPWRYLTCRRQVAKMRGKNCRGVFVKRRDIMTKPFLPFFAPDIGPEEIHEVTETLKSGWLTTGPRTKQFEQDFAKYIGCKHAIAVNSCTAALHLALDAIGLQPGDEVIVPTMTFAATAEVVCYFRAKPVFVDCEPDTQNIDARLIEEKITPRTKAIIPVHFGGLPCDMDAIRAVAAKHGLKVIEDAAHALPARYNGKLVGTIGDLTAFSFYANKTITTGEGGMLTTDDDALAERARVMSLHGISKDAWKRFSAAGSWYYEIIRPGFKYNLTDIASALGLCQLRKCDVMNEGRRRVARLYAEGLKSVAEVELLVERKGRESAWHLFVLRLKLERLRIDRAEFFEQMKAAGIGCSVHYVPLHMHPYYRETFSYRREDFPVASAVSERVITLPLFSKMTDSDVARVVEAVTTICRENGK
jgi:perosamine synthetase